MDSHIMHVYTYDLRMCGNHQMQKCTLVKMRVNLHVYASQEATSNRSFESTWESVPGT